MAESPNTELKPGSQASRHLSRGLTHSTCFWLTACRLSSCRTHPTRCWLPTRCVDTYGLATRWLI